MIGKIKFEAEVGLLIRGAFRKSLNKLKSDVLWKDPKAKIEITETKCLLDSHFIFKCANVDEKLIQAISQYYAKLQKEFS